MVVVIACIGAVLSVSMHVRCIDAARETARLAARSESAADAVAVGLRVAPSGARISVREDGNFVFARVDVSSPLPGLDIGADAVAAIEPTAQ